MKTRLIIDGNAVYEIDEECMEYRNKKKPEDSQDAEKTEPEHRKRCRES